MRYSLWRPEYQLRHRGLHGVECVEDPEEQGRGGLYSHKGRVARAIEVAHPDDQDIVIKQARGPGIAKSPRRSGLPRDLHGFLRPHRRVVGARVLQKHGLGQEGRLLRQESCAHGDSLLRAMTQRAQYPFVRQHCVKRGHFFHGDFAAS